MSAQPPEGPAPIDERRAEAGAPVANVRSRLSPLTVAGLVVGCTVLGLLIAFILENRQRVSIAFLGSHSHAPLGVALLIAAVVGLLLGVLFSAIRGFRTRRRARAAGRLGRSR